MYLKPISFWTSASCSCQSARSPSLARPAPMHCLKVLQNGPLMWAQSAEMMRDLIQVYRIFRPCFKGLKKTDGQ